MHDPGSPDRGRLSESVAVLALRSCQVEERFGFQSSVSASPSMDIETKHRITDLALDADATTILALSCPGCGGSINIQFVSRDLRGKGVGSLSVMCPQCMWRVIADGLRTEPPWVRKLGPKIQTANYKNDEVARVRE